MIGQINASQAGQQVLSPLPAPMCDRNPHVYINVGHENNPVESMSTLEFLFDTGAQTNTALLENMIPYMRHNPHNIKCAYDSGNGEYAPIPLCGMIGDKPVLQQMSTLLPVLVVFYTPYVDVYTKEPVYLPVLCGTEMSIRGVIGVPFMIESGEGIINLQEMFFTTPNWNCGHLPLRWRHPTNEPIPVVGPPDDQLKGKLMEIDGVMNNLLLAAVFNAASTLEQRYLAPFNDARATGGNTPGYGTYGHRMNPLLDITQGHRDGVDELSTRFQTLDVINPVVRGQSRDAVEIYQPPESDCPPLERFSDRMYFRNGCPLARYHAPRDCKIVGGDDSHMTGVINHSRINIRKASLNALLPNDTYYVPPGDTK